MPARGSYQIANREEGKAAARDQSYRSCVTALLIFFLFCIIVLIICQPWRFHSASNQRHHSSGYDMSNAAKHHGSIDTQEERKTSSTIELPTTTEEQGDIITDKFASIHDEHVPYQRYSVNKTTRVAEATTDTVVPADPIDPVTENVTINLGPRILVDETEIADVPTVTSENVTARTEFYIPVDRIENSTINDDNESFLVTETTVAFSAVTEIENQTLEHAVSNALNVSESPPLTTISSDVTTDIESTYNDVDIFSSAVSNSTEQFAKLYRIDDSSTSEYTIDTSVAQTTDMVTESTTTPLTTFTEGNLSLNDSTFPSTAMVTDEANVTVASNYFTIPTVTSTVGTTENEDLSTESATASPEPNVEVCDSGHCKQIASKVASYMNHSTDPCEDFYEYACGGMEADPQIVDRDLSGEALQRIRKRAEEEANFSRSSTIFNRYYKSCMLYDTAGIEEKIKSAKQELNAVGRFYTIDNWTGNNRNITDLLAKLLLRHSALLFDIVPDIDEHEPTDFTLKIGPPTYPSPFDTEADGEEKEESTCYSKYKSRAQKEFLDLEKAFKEYVICKQRKKKFIDSVREAIQALEAFSELDGKTNVLLHRNKTLINIETHILNGFFVEYPSAINYRSKVLIQETYMKKDHANVTFMELEADSKLVNWTELVYKLTNYYVQSDALLQVYFRKEMIAGFKHLENITQDASQNMMELNNALLALYAHDIYQRLVLSRHRDARSHCLRVAANLLIPEASYLYMSSFTDQELAYMKDTVTTYFDESIKTLRLSAKTNEWATKKLSLIKKIDELKLIVPERSYFTEIELMYENYTAEKLNLSDNYFNNSVVLLKRYRKLIYQSLTMRPAEPKQIWTHYATPFQSRAQVIRALNITIIPLGSIDWSMISRYNENSLNYFILATLGNEIAIQIAHHFDTNGIRYWNGIRHFDYSYLNEDDPMDRTFEEYTECHNILYETPINVTRWSTDQTISFKISKLTLNKRLADITGLRLAYDTFTRLRSFAENWMRTPWLGLNRDQLFFVAYAQMYCTKLPLTASYISSYGKDELPGRIRIFVSASNNEALGKAWDCRIGSQVLPSQMCSAFPHLEMNSEERATELDAA